MKTERYAPWMYISGAILVFILVVVVSAGITSALDTSRATISWDRLFGSHNAPPIYLPFVSEGSVPGGITINTDAGDNGLGLQDWVDSENP